MSTQNNYFVINETINVTPRRIRISGDLILTGKEKELISTEIDDGLAPDRSKLPQTVYWVLPPPDNTLYTRIKKLAGDFGYQTVEHNHLR
jgi:hypothetical protein